MLSAISIAANGLAVESRRVEAVARTVASMGAIAPASSTAVPQASPVRVGTLHSADPIESMVTLVEAQNAYRMNTVVIRTADDMLGSLLRAVAPRR